MNPRSLVADPGARLDPILCTAILFLPMAVLLSAVTQGWTMPILARRLNLVLPPRPVAPVTLEISSIQHLDGDILEYTLAERSRAAHADLDNVATLNAVTGETGAGKSILLEALGLAIGARADRSSASTWYAAETGRLNRHPPITGRSSGL